MVGGGGGGESSSVFYGDTPSRGPSPHPVITIFARKSNPFHIAKVETLHSISLGLLNNRSTPMSSTLHLLKSLPFNIPPA